MPHEGCILDAMSAVSEPTAPNRTNQPRKRTKAEGLHGKQERALRVLLGGGSITEAAEAAKVRRATVSQWVNHNAEFKAELRRQQGDLRGAVRKRLEVAAGDAVGVLHDLLGDPNARNRLLAAKSILGLVSDLTDGSGHGSKVPSPLGGPEPGSYTGEVERKRMEELSKFPLRSARRCASSWSTWWTAPGRSSACGPERRSSARGPSASPRGPCHP